MKRFILPTDYLQYPVSALKNHILKIAISYHAIKDFNSHHKLF